MVLSYFSKLPRKPRLVIVSIGVCLIFIQVIVLAKSARSPLFSQTQHDDEIITPEPIIERSILKGFGGFTSRLPQMQFDFPPEPLEYTELRERRRESIKKSFLHGWDGYKKYAFGHDELKPLSNKFKDPFGGWGATLVDSLSTLLVMELESEFADVMPYISQIDFKIDEDVSVFESIIRYLGGLISAYELSDRKQEKLLSKAQQLAQVLLPAFDTPSGFPHHLWNPKRNTSTSFQTLIAEVGTVQLEFMMLSQLTRDPIYGRKAQDITDFLDEMGYDHGVDIKGLFPTTLDVYKGRFVDATVRFGAMGDSAFEYLLKEYLLVDGSVPQYGKMYTQAIKSMKRNMLRQVPGYDLLLLPPFDTQEGTSRSNMDHLTCFVPGMLAMGAKTFDEPEDLDIAKKMMETCVYMYRTTETGLSADSWSISKTDPYNPLTYNKSKEDLELLRDWWYEVNQTSPIIERKQEKQRQEELMQKLSEDHNTTTLDDNISKEQLLALTKDEKQEDPKQIYFTDYQLPKARERPDTLFFLDERYVLRPETIESLFILYRITGDQKYQEYGWEIYQAIETHCRTKSAYAVVRNVDGLQSYEQDIVETDDDSETDAPEFEEEEVEEEEEEEEEEELLVKRQETDYTKNQIDSMESFLFAETFKYLYLLFSPPDILSLDKFIFNTEAHPFIRKQWNWNTILDSKK